jgi:hypothetical protein
MQFSILAPADSEWKACFQDLPLDQRDIFYSPEYANVFDLTVNKEDEVYCAKLSSQDGIILYPFVKRNLSKISSLSIYSEYYDICGLYGRGGVISSAKSRQTLEKFNLYFSNYCKDSSIICNFDRFHPIIRNEIFAFPGEDVRNIGGFIAVDLRPSIEDIRGSFKSSVNKDIRKGERNGISCFREQNIQHLDDFMRVYGHTMDRNSATKFYYFSEFFFKVMNAEMRKHFNYFYAVFEGKIISCELVLHCGKYCHSFLGGTLLEALPLAANPILKFEIIKYYKQIGCEFFLLGGGSAPDDGIFNFKKAYAPKGIYPSLIGGSIWNQEVYSKLKEDMFLKGAPIREDRFQYYEIS